MEGGEGVAEGVEAGPGGAGLLDEGLEDTGPEVAGIERGAGVVGEEDRRRVLIGLGGEVAAEPCGEGGREADLAAAVLGLRGLGAAVNDRATDADLWRWAVQLDVEALQGDRLADPQTGRRQELQEQPVAP